MWQYLPALVVFGSRLKNKAVDSPVGFLQIGGNVLGAHIVSTSSLVLSPLGVFSITFADGRMAYYKVLETVC